MVILLGRQQQEPSPSEREAKFDLDFFLLFHQLVKDKKKNAGAAARLELVNVSSPFWLLDK